MEQLIKNLPIAVYSAIFLFVLKEVVEFVRRLLSKKRKITAFKLLLAQEIERNHWTFRAVFQTIKDLNSILNELNKEFPNPEFKVTTKQNGDLEYCRKLDANSKDYSSWRIPVVRTELYNKLLPEIAEIDKKLFEMVIETYTQIGELVHIRNGFTEYIVEDKAQDFISGFPVYAEGLKNDIFNSMGKLYKYCTGIELKTIRTR